MFYAKNTENKSFIKVWRELQRYDVSNNIFHLSVQQKSLTNYTENTVLSLDKDTEKDKLTFTLRRITSESKTNIWFYFRELVYVKDINSDIDAYIHFQINKRILYMIYLYTKGKSFIIRNPNDEELQALKLIWFYEKSMYNNDLVFGESEKIIDVNNEVNKIIKHMPIKISLGSTQAINNSIDKNHYFITSKDYIISTFNNKNVHNEITDKLKNININKRPSIYSFINTNVFYLYPYMFDFLDNCQVYCAISNYKNSENGQLFYNTCKAFIPEINEGILDLQDSQLNNIYFI